YAANREGRAPQLDEPSLQYADYAIWQGERMEGEAYEEGLAFWRRHLEGARESIDWPTAETTAAERSPAEHVQFEWAETVSEAVRQCAKARETSRFLVLYAAFAGYLGRVSGQWDVTVGVPVTQRQRPELQDVLGFFLNTLPMRARSGPALSFEQWLGEVVAQWREVVPHQWIPLDAIVDAVGAERTGRGLPLFDAMFTFVPEPGAPSSLAELDAEFVDTVHAPEAKCGISVIAGESDGRIDGVIEYDAARFERRFVEQLAETFEHFVAESMANVDRPMGAHPLVDDQPRRRLLEEWGRGPVREIPDQPIHRTVERRASEHPERTAIAGEDREITYGELNRAANRVASVLQARGVGPNEAVGVAVERSPALVAALLGVWKAGAGYVAMPPETPGERLETILEDADPALVVADRAGRRAIGSRGIDIVDLEEALDNGDPDRPEVDVDGNHLAYVLYTSGTTGRPKGVEVPHRAVRNFLEVLADEVGLSDEDVVLQKSPYGFDASVLEIVGALGHGATLVTTRPGAEVDPAYLADRIAEQEVTVMDIVPSQLRLLIEELARRDDVGSLERVISAGEALSVELRDDFFEQCDATLINQWGPTEACISGSQRVCHPEGPRERVPIGKPLTNYQLYLVDGEGRLVPNGMAGEAVVAGEGLTRGYRRAPARTAAAFLPHPFSERAGARMYATGDRMRWGESGELEFLGRVDRQVQIHGRRVEPAAVEEHLERAPGVREAAVRVSEREAGRTEELFGYVIAEIGEEPEVDELRTHLAAHLAEAAIPGHFVELEEMPRTPTGKLDRAQLPAPNERMRREGRTSPRGAVEETVAAIWREHLEVEEVGVEENFFELGGHSLLAVRMREALREACGRAPPLREMFEQPTVAAWATAIQEGDRESSTRITAHDYELEVPVSAEQRRLWFLQRVDPTSVAYQVPAALRLEGDVDREALREAFEALVARHEILRTVYPARGGEPVQRIQPDRTVDWSYRIVDAKGIDEQIDRVVAKPFDLADTPPLRVRLWQVDEQEYVLLALFHHIAIDEWTMGV
ncbi:MAG: amino acid adenylation domain-containing protein, partial [Bradymonadaceae bacterium]